MSDEEAAGCAMARHTTIESCDCGCEQIVIVLRDEAMRPFATAAFSRERARAFLSAALARIETGDAERLQ